MIVWNKVTRLSWGLTLFFFFLVFPALAFYIGIQYEAYRQVQEVSREGFRYENAEAGIALRFPPDFGRSPRDFSGYLPKTKTPVGALVLPRSVFSGTNLLEAGIFVGATTTPDIVASCLLKDEGESERDPLFLGGEKLLGFESVGAGAGNFYESRIYRLVRGGKCLEFVEMLHSGNIGNYSSGEVKEFDRNLFIGRLNEVLSTLSFL